MESHGLPVLMTLFVWWFSTGAILFLTGLPRWTFRWSMAGASLVGALSLYGLAVTASDTTPAGAYLAALSALGVWGWNETGFLLGHVTGSRRTACPADARGFERFVYATQSILHHEALILVSGLAVVAVTWDGANPFGLWTFLVLWLMRLSTKFNIFLGVPNVTVEFLPAHLAYLKSYFANRPMNLLFPFSVTASTVVTVWLALKVAAAAPGSFEATGHALVVSLLALAVLEHWFLVIPLPFGDLWSWGLSSRAPAGRRLAAIPASSPAGRAPATSDHPDMAAAGPKEAGNADMLPSSALPLTVPDHGQPSSRLAGHWPSRVSCAGANR